MPFKLMRYVNELKVQTIQSQCVKDRIALKLRENPIKKKGLNQKKGLRQNQSHLNHSAIIFSSFISKFNF
jgi:hypothetical protein